MKINDVIILESPQCGDTFAIELGECLIESEIVGFTDDGVIIEADNKALVLMHINGAAFEQGIMEGSMFKSLKRAAKLWDGPAHLKDVIDYVRNAPDDVLIRFAKGKGEMPGSHTPRDLQIKLINQELKRRFGLTPRGNERSVDEAKYQGREVPLGKPMRGDVAKSKVYVKGPKGNVVKVNFGDKKMKIKKSNPKRRKSFRARHNCANPGPRWKARYWSCRAW